MHLLLFVVVINSSSLRTSFVFFVFFADVGCCLGWNNSNNKLIIMLISFHLSVLSIQKKKQKKKTLHLWKIIRKIYRSAPRLLNSITTIKLSVKYGLKIWFHLLLFFPFPKQKKSAGHPVCALHAVCIAATRRRNLKLKHSKNTGEGMFQTSEQPQISHLKAWACVLARLICSIQHHAIKLQKH